jgi:uncharacterized iron-regulated protein
MVRPTAFAVFLFVLFTSSAHAESDRMYFRVKDIRVISLETMAAELQHARIVFIGEQHANWAHHQGQLEIIQAVLEQGSGVALAFEMFRSDSQNALDGWVAGELPTPQLYRLFADNWSLDWWPLYRDILFFARDREIPVLGLNEPEDLFLKVSRHGLEALEEGESADLPEATCDVEPEYMRVLRLTLGDGGHGAPDIVSICEAQVLRDALMARNLVRFAEEYPDRVIIVLAGNFHAWKHGVPARFKRLATMPYRVVLPSSREGSYFQTAIRVEHADYVLWIQ